MLAVPFLLFSLMQTEDCPGKESKQERENTWRAIKKVLYTQNRSVVQTYAVLYKSSES
jgi:hypothetical protein